LGKEFQVEKYSSKLDVKDITDLEKINDLGVNIITTQINNESTIDELKELLGEKQMKIFARIETSEAICNFDSIIERCDGIIIDHGFISTKIPYEDVTKKYLRINI
jgi:pyruvate kinase